MKTKERKKIHFQRLYRTKPLFLFLLIAYIFSACSGIVLHTMGEDIALCVYGHYQER